MIKQMFKLIWNRKRQNFLMMTGIFISFFALFLVLTTIMYNLGNYFKPLGFDYKDVWYLSLDWKNLDPEQVAATMEQLDKTLDSQPEILSHAYSISYIFMPSATSMDDYTYTDKTLSCHVANAGDDFPEVMDVELVRGRWFGPEDNALARLPVVINKYAAEALFGTEDPIGKIIFEDENEKQVVGVIGELRTSGEFGGSRRLVIQRSSLRNELTRSFLTEEFFIRILFEVAEGTGMDFEEHLLKLSSSVASDWMVKIGRLEDQRESANKQAMIIPVILAIICGFLIINVALGLFGVIWYNTNRRKPEIGLRRAFGSTIKQIYSQIVGESLVLSTFGIILGLFLALQFPLLGIIPFISTATYILAITVSIGAIYLITVICAIYPSSLAAGIQPAIALHDE